MGEMPQHSPYPNDYVPLGPGIRLRARAKGRYGDRNAVSLRWDSKGFSYLWPPPRPCVTTLAGVGLLQGPLKGPHKGAPPFMRDLVVMLMLFAYEETKV